MTTTAIDSLAPFTEPADWRTMMATMVEPALRAQISAKSQVMNEPWMRLIFEGGLLRLPEICKQPHRDVAAFTDGAEQWSSRLIGFTKFTTGSTMTMLKTEKGESTWFLSNGGPQNVKELFARATTEMVADFLVFSEHPLIQDATATNNSLNAMATWLVGAMATWLAGAIALDLPESVAEVLRAAPAVANQSLSIDVLGHEMHDYLLPMQTKDGLKMEGDHSASLTAQGIALTLSREACLDVLWDHGVSPLDKIGTHTLKVVATDDDQQSSVYSDDFFVDDLTANIIPLCTPNAWEKALKKTVNDPEHSEDRKNALYDHAINVLMTDEMPWMGLYVPVFINANVYHQDPVNSMRVAANFGAIQVLDAVLPDIQWDLPSVGEVFFEKCSPLVNAPQNPYYGNFDERESGILKLMDAAVAGGRADLVEPRALVDDHSGGEYLVPLFGFADAGFMRAILKSIDNGWDPRANPPESDGVPTLMQYADEHAPNVAHAIRTRETRAKAFDALDSIDKQAPRQGAR